MSDKTQKSPWSPIETAPRDGTHIWGRHVSGRGYEIWLDEHPMHSRGVWRSHQLIYWTEQAFTHWATMPPPVKP